MTHDELLKEADRVVAEAQEEAAAKVRARLGPTPRDRERLVFGEAPPTPSATRTPPGPAR